MAYHGHGHQQYEILWEHRIRRRNYLYLIKQIDAKALRPYITCLSSLDWESIEARQCNEGRQAGAVAFFEHMDRRDPNLRYNDLLQAMRHPDVGLAYLADKIDPETAAVTQHTPGNERHKMSMQDGPPMSSGTASFSVRSMSPERTMSLPPQLQLSPTNATNNPPLTQHSQSTNTEPSLHRNIGLPQPARPGGMNDLNRSISLPPDSISNNNNQEQPSGHNNSNTEDLQQPVENSWSSASCPSNVPINGGMRFNFNEISESPRETSSQNLTVDRQMSEVSYHASENDEETIPKEVMLSKQTTPKTYATFGDDSETVEPFPLATSAGGSGSSVSSPQSSAGSGNASPHHANNVTRSQRDIDSCFESLPSSNIATGTGEQSSPGASDADSSSFFRDDKVTMLNVQADAPGVTPVSQGSSSREETPTDGDAAHSSSAPGVKENDASEVADEIRSAITHCLEDTIAVAESASLGRQEEEGVPSSAFLNRQAEENTPAPRTNIDNVFFSLPFSEKLSVETNPAAQPGSPERCATGGLENQNDPDGLENQNESDISRTSLDETSMNSSIEASAGPNIGSTDGESDVAAESVQASLSSGRSALVSDPTIKEEKEECDDLDNRESETQSPLVNEEPDYGHQITVGGHDQGEGNERAPEPDVIFDGHIEEYVNEQEERNNHATQPHVTFDSQAEGRQHNLQPEAGESMNMAAVAMLAIFNMAVVAGLLQQ